MLPRLRLPAMRQWRPSSRSSTATMPQLSLTHISRSSYASLATTPVVDIPILAHHSNNQPPSYKPAEFRKTQLHRQYASLLRSSPLILLFQHNNLKAVEWSGLRRELAAALKVVDADLASADPSATDSQVGAGTKLQIMQTGIFASALKVVEFWKPEQNNPAAGPQTALSKKAYETAKSKNRKLRTGLEPLLSGPLMAVTFPAVSPQHVKAALHILAPNEKFPAPKRKANPGLYELPVQTGLQKLMLLGARVDGEVFDMEGTRWVGGIEGGIGGLRSQIVYLLSSVGAGITNTLEGAAKSLYVTVESRRIDMEGPAESSEEKIEEPEASKE